MNAPLPRLPELLQIVADAAGIESAIALVRALGGRHLYIPKQAGPGHPLVLACGRAGADALIKARGGEHVSIPKRGIDVRRIAAITKLSGDASITDAVIASGYSHRHCERLRAELKSGGALATIAAAAGAPKRLKRDERQMDLEDFLK
jgi:hypothetical protein